MDTTDSTVTSEEAFSFLRDVLDVASPKNKMATDPLSLLNEIMSPWHYRIPFQTITSIATPHDKRHLPTLQEIKSAIFAKQGGCCYDTNVGCYMMLRALGYDVHLVAGDMKNISSNHVSVIANNLSYEGSRHLIDAGIGAYPTFLPIPLDFTKESPEYHESYIKYKFVKRGETIVRLHSAETDPAGAKRYCDFLENGWYAFVVTHFKAAVDLSHFKEPIEKIYTEVIPVPPFLTSPRSSAFPQGRLVCILNTTLLLEDEEGTITKTYFRSRDELLQAYAKYFPQLQQEMVQAALDDVNVKLDFNKEAM